MPIEVRQNQNPPKDSDALLSALLDSSVIATIGVSLSGEILSSNTTMRTLLGLNSSTDLLSDNLRTCLLSKPSDWQHWEKAVAGRVNDIEVSFRANNGDNLVLKGDILPIVDEHRNTQYLYGVFGDITSVKQLQSALRRAARMEAVGNLTSGVAHDFNNLLTVLVGNLYLVAEGVRSDASLFDKAKRARDAAKRGADLTRQLLSFARSEDLESEQCDPEKIVRNLEPLLKRAIGSKISLTSKFDDNIPLVLGNIAQFESVIVNLVINARDAIDGEGVILIDVAKIQLGFSDGVKHGLPAGEYVRISVKDDGSGIPDNLREKIFEPFFSTKSDGKGTGLGLSMVRWFADQVGGTASLESYPNQGTTVALLLPCSEHSTADSTIKTMPLSTLPTGKESVLILAQDRDIRSTVQQILEVLGYAVRLSNELDEASGIVASEVIDLVMIDSTANLDAGIARSAKTLTDLRPSIKTIRIDDASSYRSDRKQGLGHLIKPFSLLELATVVRQTLDGVTND